MESPDRPSNDIEQRLEAQNRELATLLSVQQAITSRLDRQAVLGDYPSDGSAPGLSVG